MAVVIAMLSIVTVEVVASCHWNMRSSGRFGEGSSFCGSFSLTTERVSSISLLGFIMQSRHVCERDKFTHRQASTQKGNGAVD